MALWQKKKPLRSEAAIKIATKHMDVAYGFFFLKQFVSRLRRIFWCWVRFFFIFVEAFSCCFCAVVVAFVICADTHDRQQLTLLTVWCGLSSDSHDIVAERLNSLHFIMSHLILNLYFFFAMRIAFNETRDSVCFLCCRCRCCCCCCAVCCLVRPFNAQNRNNRMQMAIIGRLFLDLFIFNA